MRRHCGQSVAVTRERERGVLMKGGREGGDSGKVSSSEEGGHSEKKRVGEVPV